MRNNPFFKHLIVKGISHLHILCYFWIEELIKFFHFYVLVFVETAPIVSGRFFYAQYLCVNFF